MRPIWRAQGHEAPPSQHVSMAWFRQYTTPADVQHATTQALSKKRYATKRSRRNSTHPPPAPSRIRRNWPPARNMAGPGWQRQAGWSDSTARRHGAHSGPGCIHPCRFASPTPSSRRITPRSSDHRRRATGPKARPRARIQRPKRRPTPPAKTKAACVVPSRKASAGWPGCPPSWFASLPARAGSARLACVSQSSTRRPTSAVKHDGLQPPVGPPHPHAGGGGVRGRPLPITVPNQVFLGVPPGSIMHMDGAAAAHSHAQEPARIASPCPSTCFPVFRPPTTATMPLGVVLYRARGRTARGARGHQRGGRLSAGPGPARTLWQVRRAHAAQRGRHQSGHADPSCLRGGRWPQRIVAHITQPARTAER